MRIRSETRMEGQGGHVGRCWAHCGRCQGREVHMRISREYKEKLKKRGKKKEKRERTNHYSQESRSPADGRI